MPRKRKAEAEIPSIFDSLGIPGPAAEPADRAPQPGEGDEPTLKDLMDRISGLETRFSSAPPQQPIVIQHQAPPPAADPPQLLVTTDGLPDMVQEPERYNTELTKRINAAITAQTLAVAQNYDRRASVQENTDRAWSNFADDYPDWAPYKTLVGAAALELVREVEARGGDANQFMFGNPKQFNDAVVKRLKDQGYTALIEGEDEEGDDEAALKPRKRRTARESGMSDEEEETIRTAGIFGGQESGGAPAPAAPPPGNMADDLRAVQRRLGLYR